MLKAKKNVDVIYIEGSGDIVESLTRWHHQEDVITETSRTFSGQVFDFCKKNDLKTLAISAFNETKRVDYGDFCAFSRPKPMFKGGIGFHISQILNGFNILATAIRYRPKYLHIANGATHWFMLAPLKLFGIKIFPHLHNTFWVKSYLPTGKIKRLLIKLDAWFLKNIASAAFCCSPEIIRQIQKMTQGKSCPAHLFKAQFYAHSFKETAALKSHAQSPFVVVYAGRIERAKGVFDVLKMAKKTKHENIVFHLCGDGSDLNELIAECKQEDLCENVTIHGVLNRPDLLKIYQQGHVVIVPTRSDFTEGFAMVAAEAILLGRPIITSKIVPAIDVLSSAALKAKVENVDSYVNAIQILQLYKNIYDQTSAACLPLRAQFLNGKQGLTNVLQHTLN